MKCFVIVLFVTTMAWNNSGMIFYPNIQLNFEAITQTPSIEYSIELMDVAYSPFLEIGSKEIFLRGKLGGNDEIWWQLRIKNSKNFDCDKDHNTFLFQRHKMFKENITNENNAQEGRKLEVLDVFFDNNSMLLLPELEGCKNAPKNDKINQNQVQLILFKNSEATELVIFGLKFTVYSTMLGYIRFMNTAIEGNTNEQNEAVFNDLIEYCQKVANFANNSYIPTFDHIYLEDIFKPSKKAWTNYIVCLSIVVVTIILLIIIKFCFY